MKKDWKGVLRSKEIVAALIFMPAIFTVLLPIMMMVVVLIDPDAFIAEFRGADLMMALLNIPAYYNNYLK